MHVQCWTPTRGDSNIGNQIPNADPECIRDGLQRLQGEVFLATLHCADVCPVETAEISKHVLAPPLFPAECADSLANHLDDILHYLKFASSLFLGIPPLGILPIGRATDGDCGSEQRKE
jgi:hypothetical protein